MKFRNLLWVCIAVVFTNHSLFSQSSPNLGSVATNPANTKNSTPTIQNQIGTDSLGIAYSNNQCGLNFITVTQKMGRRFVPVGPPQPTTVLVPPLPCPNPASIIKAFLWCDASGNGAPITATITNPLAVTQSFPMTVVGSGPDKCWGYQGTYTYRADVTSIIAGSGNYILSGFPTNPPTPGNDVDGATIIIIYKDPNATYQGSIVIWDGCNTKLGGNAEDTITGMNVCGPAQNAQGFMIVSDLQNIAPGAFLMINGSAPFNLPAGTEDWWNYIQRPTTVVTGPTFAHFQCRTPGDCFNFLLMGMYWQTTTCVTCVPATGTVNTTMAATGSSCSNPNGSATVTASGGTGPYTYSWNTIPVQTTATATNVAPGWHRVTVTDASGCNSRLDSVLVPGNGNLSATSSFRNVKCNGGLTGRAIIRALSGTGPFTYTWTPNVSTSDTARNLPAGVYTVTIRDVAGCSFSQTFTITQPPASPIVSEAGNDVSICFGKSVTLTATATGGDGGAYTYSWSNGAGINPIVTVSPTTTTNYIIAVRDSCGTPTSYDTVKVTVNPLPVVSFTPNINKGCAPLCVSYTNATLNATNCSWNFGDSQTSTSCTVPLTHCYTTAGIFTVKLAVTNNNGCTDSVRQNNLITVYQNPNAGFLYGPQPTTLENPNIGFTDLSVNGDTCIWILGDGNTLIVPNCTNFNHIYPDTGTYRVIQIVRTKNGCTDTIRHNVVITPFTTFYVPNAFTPNGDGKNEVFKPIGEFVKNYELLIFDRWGNQIFKSNDFNTGWDGRVMGGSLISEVDTYVYVIKFQDYFNKTYKYIGSVNLIR